MTERMSERASVMAIDQAERILLTIRENPLKYALCVQQRCTFSLLISNWFEFNLKPTLCPSPINPRDSKIKLSTIFPYNLNYGSFG